MNDRIPLWRYLLFPLAIPAIVLGTYPPSAILLMPLSIGCGLMASLEIDNGLMPIKTTIISIGIFIPWIIYGLKEWKGRSGGLLLGSMGHKSVFIGALIFDISFLAGCWIPYLRSLIAK